MIEIIDFSGITKEELFEVVMSTCTKLANKEIDDLHAACIIMDAVHVCLEKEKTASH